MPVRLPRRSPSPTFSGSVGEAERQAVLDAPHFRRWSASICESFDVESIVVHDVRMFGRRVGFVLVEADARDMDGVKVPGVALLRGDAVAVLLVLRLPDGTKLVVMTRQARVPVGAPAFHEIPAGMLDGGVFASKALEEIAEEVGTDIVLTEDDLVPVGDFHPSPGGSDESVRLYVAEIDVDEAQAASLHGRRTGMVSESESIQVVLATLEEARRLVAKDMKSVLAMHFYISSNPA